MPTKTCISLTFSAGHFGSDTGTIIRRSGSRFPISYQRQATENSDSYAVAEGVVTYVGVASGDSYAVAEGSI